MGILEETILAATRRLEREPCLQALARGGLELLGGAVGLGYLPSASGDDLECVAGAGEGDPGIWRQALGVLDAGLIQHLTPGGPALVEDGEALLPTGEEAGLPELGQALLVPLPAISGSPGLLLLFTLRGDRFAPAACAKAAELAREAVPALENLRTVESLRELVIRDDTADCYNRRYLDKVLEDETERARRFGAPFAVIFLDMDNLKEVNTLHGHAAGSRVLYEASVRISRSVRSIDRLFRYGGDEFVIMLPGTHLEGAREVADRIRRELAGKPFELGSGARVILTASAGVASYPEHGPSGRSVLEAGDTAMRRVKEHGKNSVGMAPLPPAGS